MAQTKKPALVLSGEPSGVRRIPLRRQANGYSCGSTCMRMVLDHLEFAPHLSVDNLSDIMGTNPRTGTTHIEMERGLVAMGLSYAHPDMSGFAGRTQAMDHLRTTLDEGNIVFLRTLLHGYKHWVVVHAHVPGREFLVTCPCMGLTTWSADEVHDAWSARDYDHFTAPARHSLHPEAVARLRQQNTESYRPVHQMSLRDYTENAVVVRDDKQASWHRMIIASAAEDILAMGAELVTPGQAGMAELPPGAYVIDYPHRGELCYVSMPRDGSTRDMVVVDPARGLTVGGIVQGVRWVNPGFRGRGLGAEIALAACCEPEVRYLHPSSYSEGGFASRVHAHRLAVKRALEAGLDVPDHAIRSDMGADPAAPAKTTNQLSFF